MNLKNIIVLMGAFFLYSLSSVFTKLSSMYPFLSVRYCLFLSCAILVLGLFAIIWQQIIKRMHVSDAYMFKGMTVVFVLLLSFIIFDERVTMTNLLGSAIIVCGIALFAKS